MAGAKLAARLGSFERQLAGVSAAAFVLRLLYLILAKQGPDACGQALCGDANYYAMQADIIADGRWFDDPADPGNPAADHPPLTAVVLSVPGLFFGTNLNAKRTVVVLAGVAVVVAAGYLGRRLGGGRLKGDRVGIIAAIAAAIYPNLWVNDVLLMSDTFATLIIASLLIAIYRFIDKPTWAASALIGGLLGLAALTRGELLLLAPIVIVPSLLLTRLIPIGDRLLRLVVAGAVCVAVIAPWFAYNQTRFKEPVVLSTNDGLTLLGANCDETYYGASKGLWRLDCGLEVGEGDQSQASSKRRDAAFEYIGDNTSQLAQVMAIRVGRVWSLYSPNEMVWYNQGEGRETWASWAGFWMYVMLLPFAAAGAVLLYRRKVPIWPLVGTFVVVTVTAALFYGLLRFRLTAEISIVVLAAVALERLWRHIRVGPTDATSCLDSDSAADNGGGGSESGRSQVSQSVDAGLAK